MQYSKLALEEKGKLLNLMSKKFIKLDFSKLTSVVENNLADPRWMDLYILIYKSGLAPDIQAYDILLKKLSTPVLKFSFTDGDKNYISNATITAIDLYLWYQITGEVTYFFAETQFMPKKDYMKELFKFNKFYSAGIFLENVDENRFRIAPTDYQFDNIEDATIFYNKFLDAFDAYRSLKLPKENFIKHINQAIEHGKDKRMLATISNILSYFNLQFELKDDYITLKGSGYKITNEKEADRFQVKLIDAYQFFRNVVNTEDKKDIVSEIYNRRLSSEIRNQFEEHVNEYVKVTDNQELIDWIITISKESKYTLNITFDDQGTFYIDNNRITTPAEAKEYYIDFMDAKKEKLAMAIYKNNILNRIKNIWNKFRAKFAKI